MVEDGVTIKELPMNERPREKVLSYGFSSLSNAELIAILLRTGTRKESSIQIANKLLIQLNGLKNILNSTLEEITSIKGIGPTKAVQLLTAIELGKRINQSTKDEKYTIRSPQDCAEYLKYEMSTLCQEHFVCLYLNTKNQIIYKQTVFIGSLNASIVHPREVFNTAIKKSAASVICAHNHPSGDPTPSKEDIDVTKRLVECGKIIGIELLDHIIIGDDKYISLKEKGYL
ncbi:MAG: repair protein RadC [Bacillales bacterium]|jgi:DNA repair protein RadC|nr:repair protein RadC [Bacillales bacterium]